MTGKIVNVGLRIGGLILALLGCLVVIGSVSLIAVGRWRILGVGIVCFLALLIGVGMAWGGLLAFRDTKQRARVLSGVLAVAVTYVALGVVFMWPVVTWRAIRQQSAASYPCITNLRQINAAKEQAATEYGWTKGTPIVMNSDRMVKVNGYIKGMVGATNTPYCPGGGSYTYNAIGVASECSLDKDTSRGLTRVWRWLSGGKKKVTFLTWKSGPSHRLPHNSGSNAATSRRDNR